MPEHQGLTVQQGDAATGQYVRERLMEHNTAKATGSGPREAQPLFLVLRSPDGTVLGGINATLNLYWSRCHVDIFWIDAAQRGRGYGSRLLGRVEEIARTKGCRMIHLDTFSFQAPGFYAKQGYTCFGILEDTPPGHSQHFFYKRL